MRIAGQSPCDFQLLVEYGQTSGRALIYSRHRPETTQNLTHCHRTKAGHPRKRHGPKPEAPHEKECKEPKAIVRPKVTYHKKRKQDVLLWLINHRIEDNEDYSTNGARWREDATPCVEKEPRRMPDGSETWFRGPTYIEAANFWKIPLGTIAYWWKDKEKIFDGVVPESTIPLVHPNQRNRPKAPRPPTPDPPVAMHRCERLPPHAGLAAWQAPPPLQHSGPRLASVSALYPQAIQPTGPPMHPLYRANFALGEVSNEVSHMIQNQHNLYLENLLRAIALSQTLVNDLTEAHKVLLDPESYPHYYPPGVYSQPPQQQSWSGPRFHPPPQQPTGSYSRTDDGRYIAIQPTPNQGHPLTPVHTPNVQNFPQQQYQPLPPQTGQQAGQHKWRLSSRGQHQPNTVEETSASRGTSARLKRSYTSRDGPGGTAELPIILESGGNSSERERHNGGEKRRSASGAGNVKDTAMADQLNEHNGSGHAANEAGAPDGSVAEGGNKVSSKQQSEPVVDTDAVEQDEANAIEWRGIKFAEQEPEVEPQDDSKNTSQESHDDKGDSNETQQHDAHDNVVSDAGDEPREDLKPT